MHLNFPQSSIPDIISIERIYQEDINRNVHIDSS